MTTSSRQSLRPRIEEEPLTSMVRYRLVEAMLKIRGVAREYQQVCNYQEREECALSGMQVVASFP